MAIDPNDPRVAERGFNLITAWPIVSPVVAVTQGIAASGGPAVVTAIVLAVLWFAWLGAVDAYSVLMAVLERAIAGRRASRTLDWVIDFGWPVGGPALVASLIAVIAGHPGLVVPSFGAALGTFAVVIAITAGSESRRVGQVLALARPIVASVRAAASPAPSPVAWLGWWLVVSVVSAIGISIAAALQRGGLHAISALIHAPSAVGLVGGLAWAWLIASRRRRRADQRVPGSQRKA